MYKANAVLSWIIKRVNVIIESQKRAMDIMDKYYENEKKVYFAQTEEEWQYFYDDMILTLKLSIIFLFLRCYIIDLTSPLLGGEPSVLMLPWEKLKAKLLATPGVIMWRAGFSDIYICNELESHDLGLSRAMYFLWSDLFDLDDFDIGINWFLY